MVLQVAQQDPRFRQVLLLIFGHHINLVRLDQAFEDRRPGLVGKVDQHVFVPFGQVAEQRRDQVNLLFVPRELEIKAVVTQRMMRHHLLQFRTVRDHHRLAPRQRLAALSPAEIEHQHRLARFPRQAGHEVRRQQRLARARHRAAQGNDRAPFRPLFFLAQLGHPFAHPLGEPERQPWIAPKHGRERFARNFEQDRIVQRANVRPLGFSAQQRHFTKPIAAGISHVNALGMTIDL